VSRFIALIILAVWMSWTRAFSSSQLALLPMRAGIPLFLGGYLALVIGMRLWALAAVRRLGDKPDRDLHWFNKAFYFARLAIPAWLAAGIYLLRWGEGVEHLMGFFYRWPSPRAHAELPQALMGIAPALLAWIGLWWAHYPTELASREQNVLADLNSGMPVYAPPTLWQFLESNLRLQVLAMLLPAMAIVGLRDITVVLLAIFRPNGNPGLADWIMFPATGLVFIFSPEILRRALVTYRFPDSPLRQRLESMAKAAGLRYREILLWNTRSSMGNAMVMGMLPQCRYILLSDLLVETMSPPQVEAVFAHELGHVVHRHFAWYMVFALTMLSFSMGPGTQFLDAAKSWTLRKADARAVASHVTPKERAAAHQRAGELWDEIEGLTEMVLSTGLLILVIAYLSPRFERQADVYAARTLQKSAAPPDQLPTAPAPTLSYVGEYGAGVFAGALHRVAMINQIPVDAGEWMHGSIAGRMRALHAMSGDSTHTERFDRRMRRLYLAMLACLCIFGTWAAVEIARQPATVTNNPVQLVPSSAVQAGR
jgi:STE24 endopeptidase